MIAYGGHSSGFWVNRVNNLHRSKTLTYQEPKLWHVYKYNKNERMTDWQIDWLTDWLIDWLSEWMMSEWSTEKSMWKNW